MRCQLVKTVFALLLLKLASAEGFAQPVKLQPASESDRQDVATLLREPLADTLAKAEPKGETNETAAGLKFEISTAGKFTDPNKHLDLSVPALLKGKDTSVVTVKAVCPATGRTTIVQKNPIKDIKTFVDFSAKLNAEAKFEVTRMRQDNQANFKIRLVEGKAEVSDLKIKDAPIKEVNELAQKLINDKLREEGNKLITKANESLKKAYEDGKLKLPD